MLGRKGSVGERLSGKKSGVGGKVQWERVKLGERWSREKVEWE